MTFREAVEKMLEGFYVRRPCHYWKVAVYWDRDRRKYQPLRSLPSSASFFPKLPDVVADDWEVIEGYRYNKTGENETLKEIAINDYEGHKQNDLFYKENPKYDVYEINPWLLEKR